MTDHDQRFKELLREFFAEFFALFFPGWVERFDFSRLEWLDKEMFTDPPQGERRYLDLLARVPVLQALITSGQPDAWLALLHVEIESGEAVTVLRPRMSEYYHLLRHRLRLPVLPVALLLRVGLDGIGWDVYEERFWERPVLTFHYAYVGLPALNAADYLQSSNWLGVALSALMRIPEEQKARLKAEALRRLVQSGENDWRRFLLCETVQAYLPLQPPQVQEFDHLLTTEEFHMVMPTMKTWYDQGLEAGLAQGLERGLAQGSRKGQVRSVRLQLEKRFGLLKEEAVQRLEALSADQLDQLAITLLQAASLHDLGLEE